MANSLRDLDPGKELPPAEFRDDRTPESQSNPRLNETAAAIGSAVGTAARRVGEIREKFTVIPGQAKAEVSARADQFRESAAEKIEDATRQVKTTLAGARTRAQTNLDQLSSQAYRMLGDARQAAFQKLAHFRNRVEVMRDEEPVRLLGIVAGTAFALGVLTRVWRSNGD
jgi:acetylornithine deacetylase/succinyl-diaminopimelate desuccinylase-like protein